MPKRSPITEEDIIRVFDDECVRELLDYAPNRAEHVMLARHVRDAASAYLKNLGVLSADEVRAEIETFRKLANFKRQKTNRRTGEKYEKVAQFRENLSKQAARILLNRGGETWQPISLAEAPAVSAIGRNGEILSRKLKHDIFARSLPTADDLRDPALREQACQTIVSLCSLGVGAHVFEPYAPMVVYERDDAGQIIRKRRPKRKAELEFVGDLRLAWLMTTGKNPSRTARWSCPGPFVKLVERCLELVGAYDENHSNSAAARLINEWERRRKDERRRLMLRRILRQQGRRKRVRCYVILKRFRLRKAKERFFVSNCGSG